MIRFIVLILQFLGQQISEELIPDLNQITECSNSVELGRLLQLILGCAVNCEKKQGKWTSIIWGYQLSRKNLYCYWKHKNLLLHLGRKHPWNIKPKDLNYSPALTLNIEDLICTWILRLIFSGLIKCILV